MVCGHANVPRHEGTRAPPLLSKQQPQPQARVSLYELMPSDAPQSIRI